MTSFEFYVGSVILTFASLWFYVRNDLEHVTRWDAFKGLMFSLVPFANLLILFFFTIFYLEDGMHLSDRIGCWFKQPVCRKKNKQQE